MYDSHFKRRPADLGRLLHAIVTIPPSLYDVVTRANVFMKRARVHFRSNSKSLMRVKVTGVLEGTRRSRRNEKNQIKHGLVIGG